MPETYHLNDEAFIVVVSQPAAKTTGQALSLFLEAVGSVVGGILSHVMDASTLEMPPPPPLPQFIPVPLPPLKFTPIPDLHTLLTQNHYPGVRPTTRSCSTGEKTDCHGRKWFEDHYGVLKKNQFPSSIPPMVHEDYHWKSSYTWTGGG